MESPAWAATQPNTGVGQTTHHVDVSKSTQSMGRLRRLLTLLGTLAALTSAACSDAPVATTCCLLGITLSHPSLALAVGDSVPVSATVLPGTPAASVRWRSTRPAVVRLDTTVAGGRPAILRAVGRGADTIRVTVTIGVDTARTGVPVTVQARP